MRRISKSQAATPRKRATRAATLRSLVQESVAGAPAPARQSISREQLEYFLFHLVHYDVLTDLPNRSQFHDRLSGAIARAARQNYLAGILLLNLDHFKAVNANHGYDRGDGVLKEVAARLRQCTRKSDTLARLGSDEFAVILEGLRDKDGAVVPAQRVLNALAAPMTIDGTHIEITATVGIALFPADANDLDGLLRTADTAMCDAKDHQRNSYRFYSPELEFKTRRDELRRAEIGERLARLTPREREVLEILVAGKANKMIAYLLGASTRTIENHRAHIMEKMQANSLPELVRMVLDHHGLPPPSTFAPPGA